MPPSNAHNQKKEEKHRSEASSTSTDSPNSGHKAYLYFLGYNFWYVSAAEKLSIPMNGSLPL